MGLNEYIEKIKMEKNYWELRKRELVPATNYGKQCETMIREKEQLLEWLNELRAFREGIR